METYTQIFDEYLNHKESLFNQRDEGEKLNFLDSLEAPLSEMMESGVMGAVGKTLGVEIGENKSANLSYLQSRNYVSGTTGWRMDSSGNIYGVGGTIGGWTLGATSFTAGTGANTTGLDSGGTNPAFYAGSATPSLAPFRVTQAGALTASSATITGGVTSTSGTIGGWTIGSTTLTGGDLILDSTGFVTAGTFRTGVAGQNRIIVTKTADVSAPNQIQFYSSANSLVGSITNDYAAGTGSFNISAENSDKIELAAGGFTRLEVYDTGGSGTDFITLWPTTSTPTASEGLIFYNNNTNKLNFYNGTAWEVITSAP